jgi:NAD-dependent deacetylase
MSSSGPISIGPRDRVFVLTGAGISAESGIKTFRDAGGLWESHRVEDVASPSGFRRDPALVWRFYSERRRQAATVAPNPAHHALAALERQLGERFFLCTQNVDPLHQRAGSKRLVAMHGELAKSRFDEPGAEPFEDEGLYFGLESVPRSPRGRLLRPHICWFGEVPFELDRIADELDACSVFVTIGSSGAVYPAAGFVAAVRERSQRSGTPVRTVYVGPDAPDNAAVFETLLLGRAGDVVPGMFRVVQ